MEKKYIKLYKTFHKKFKNDENLILLPAADPEQLLPEQVINVGFWPTAEMSYGGKMLVYSNTSVEKDWSLLFSQLVCVASRYF